MPVRAPCLELGMTDRWGLWGGLGWRGRALRMAQSELVESNPSAAGHGTPVVYLPAYRPTHRRHQEAHPHSPPLRPEACEGGSRGQRDQRVERQPIHSASAVSTVGLGTPR